MSEHIPLALIAAHSTNRVIGYHGVIPWTIIADLKRFRIVTTGHPIIMGRKTWESIGSRVLKNRLNIIITRQHPQTVFPDGERADPAMPLFVTSFTEAYRLAVQQGNPDRAEPMIFVIGGERVYTEALPHAELLYITEVHADVLGDTFFPQYLHDGWVLIDELVCPPRGLSINDSAYSFKTYVRKK